MDPNPDMQSAAQRFAALEHSIQEQQNRLTQILERLDSIAATRPTPTVPEFPQTTPSPGLPSGLVPPNDSKPNRNITPAVPPYFDGDRTKGRVFWNAVQFYMSACAMQFPNNDALNMLFLGRYAQGSRTVEYYVNSFNILVSRAQ